MAQPQIVTGYAKGYDLSAAVKDAIGGPEEQANLPADFTLVEVKFSRDGIVGPSTYVKLAAATAEESESTE